MPRKNRDEMYGELELLKRENSELKGLLRDVKKILGPPNQYGFFSRYNNDKTLDVRIGGRTIRCKSLNKPELKRLEPGDPLILTNGLNVIGKDPTFSVNGARAEVKHVFTPTRVLVLYRTEELEVTVIPSLASSGLKVGDHVLMDTATQFVYEKLPEQKPPSFAKDYDLSVKFSDIGGLDAEIAELRESMEFPQRYPEYFKLLKLDPPHGALLIGPPGCGKTMIAQALAGELGRRLLYFNGAEFLVSLLGAGEEKVRAAFDEARRESCVLFIDEAESILRKRDSAGINSQLFDPLVSQVLGELDGLQKLEGVLVIFASNRRDIIDPAVIRPGRIDIVLNIKAPGDKAAKNIFSKYLIPLLPFDGDEIASAGGNIMIFLENIINEVTSYMFQEANKISFEYNADDVITGAIIASVAQNAKISALRRVDRKITASPKIFRSDIMEAAKHAIIRRRIEIAERYRKENTN